MSTSPLAGKPAPRALLVDVAQLITAYFTDRPDPGLAEQRVAFGTSGHRGSSLRASFNEAHILATTQAICEYRRQQGTNGPLYLGRDSHALSTPAFVTALEVLAGNDVTTRIDSADRLTPTPLISHAILCHNRGRTSGLADGVVVTPSHNPPEDGGFKYNPPHGGPADTKATRWIEDRANALLRDGLAGVKRTPYARARKAGTTGGHDYIASYLDDLGNVVDLDVIRTARPRLGVDPLGGSSLAVWQPMAERLGIELELVSDELDPTFRFMCVDHDGKIRMDCSSPYAMAGLIAMRERFDVAFANDPDADRHGIVARSSGLMNPNHYLAVAIEQLFSQRDGWSRSAAIGKTVVSSSLIDRVAAKLGRPLIEVPVGFKWFVDGLRGGTLGFGGEESAGASFLRRDGTVWTTDKDGPILCLLAAEITARTGRDPGEHYRRLVEELGEPVYERIDAPATPEQKAKLSKLSPTQVPARELAGEPITQMLTEASGNGAAIGGLKVVTAGGWFAARPSGTEDVYKLYAESFRGPDHLSRLQEEARAIVAAALR